MFLLWFTVEALAFRSPWPLKALVGLVAVTALLSAETALLLIALLLPFGAVVEATLVGYPYRVSQALVLAFLAMALVRGWKTRPGPRLPALMAPAGLLVALAALTSLAILTWRFVQYPGEAADTAWKVFREYYVYVDGIGLTDAARLLEGLALVGVVIALFRRRPSLARTLPAALCVSGAAAATLALLIALGLGPASLVNWYLRLGDRAAHIRDPNAAGSYFALLVCTAAGMLLRESRRRPLWFGVLLLNGIGLWLSDSRTAVAAAALSLGLAALWYRSGWTRRVRVAVMCLILAIGVSGTLVRARVMGRDPTFRIGVTTRQQFFSSAVRMVAARPLGGIGVGQYYLVSPMFLTPRMAWIYGSENAHNNFLQIGAELGLPALIAFALWIGLGTSTLARGCAADDDARLLGASAGILAFVATCLAGHPLLVAEVAFPFWLAFGLAIALAQSALIGSTPWTADTARAASTRRRTVAATVAVACAVMTGALVEARRGPVTPVHARAVEGFSDWEVGADGHRFRWSDQFASLIVPKDTRHMSIPLRVPDRVALFPVTVSVSMEGWLIDRVPVGASWKTLELDLVNGDPRAPWRRVNLRVDRSPSAHDPPGGDGGESAGVQVGEYTAR